MCKIYEFPQKNELPIEIKEDIRKLANDYFEMLLNALEYLEVDTDDLQAITEVSKEITDIYVEQLEIIVEALEDES